MVNYKNINCSFTQLDFNYIESANEYWIKYDKVYKNFLDFVDRELINRLDMKILRYIASQDKNIKNSTKFISNLKKDYLREVKKICADWHLPVKKVKGGVEYVCKS